MAAGLTLAWSRNTHDSPRGVRAADCGAAANCYISGFWQHVTPVPVHRRAPAK
jgi:hypothetical protein